MVYLQIDVAVRKQRKAKSSKLTLSSLCHDRPNQTSAPLVTWHFFLEKRTSWTQAQGQPLRSRMLAGRATLSCMDVAMVLSVPSALTSALFHAFLGTSEVTSPVWQVHI